MEIRLTAIFRSSIIYIALFIALVIFNITIFTRRPELTSWLIGGIACIALIPLFKLTIRRTKRRDAVTFTLVLVLSIILFFYFVINQSPLASLNYYPIPLLTIPTVWFFSSICGLGLYFLQVFIPSAAEQEAYIAPQRVVKILATTIASCVFVVMAFSIYASINARSVIGSPVCIVETDGASSHFKLWFSPRKMLFENEYKGSISAYLTAGTDSKNISHHWSFRKFSFLENNSTAFTSNLSFYPSKRKHC